MVLIPGGKYNYQLPSSEPKEVLLKSFYIDKFEVTIAEFERFVQVTNYKTDAEKKGFSMTYPSDTTRNANWRCDPKGKPRLKKDYNNPVMHVSYTDAVAYAKWAKKRLPTEEEWMYVASQKYPGRLKEKAWYRDNSLRSDGVLDAHPVGTKKPNTVGVYDLFGNVQEMTSSMNTRFGGHITEGLCYWFWDDHFQKDTTSMLVRDSDYSSDSIGFRCVKDV
jgi:formylglycine-generating enzyme required for sulfatase activity